MDTVKIGWGRREISSPEAMSIPGQMYMRISQGIMDPLFATALCIDGGEGNGCVIFCSCDMGNFNSGVVDSVLERVAQCRPEIPADSVILNCTHTHCSGDTHNTPPTSPDGVALYPGEKYREFVIGQITQAVCEAYDTRRSGGIAFGYGYAVVAHSRRTVYSRDMSLGEDVPVAPNGFGVMYGNTTKPEFSHYEAGADHFLNALYTVDENEKLTGIVVNVPCPSQLSEHFTKLTADFWHDVRQLVKKDFGENVYVLTQCAAAGDLSPRILHYLPAQSRRMKLKYGLEFKPNASIKDVNRVMGERYDIAERICQSLREVYSWAKKDIRWDFPVRVRKLTPALSARKVTEAEKDWCEENILRLRDRIPEAGCADAEAIRVAVTRYNAVKNRNTSIIQRYNTQPEDPRVQTTLYVAQVGDIAFATNPFELYMDFMHRIQARSPFIQTFVVQLAGGEHGGYLATERGVVNKGYSASLFDNRVSAAGGQELVETTLQTLEQLANM